MSFYLVLQSSYPGSKLFESQLSPPAYPSSASFPGIWIPEPGCFAHSIWSFIISFIINYSSYLVNFLDISHANRILKEKICCMIFFLLLF